MTQLILSRHGETVWHAENRYAGISDIDLTPRGRRQAEQLAGWAATAGLSAIYASPLSRARFTAQFSAQRTGLSVTVDERLRELDFGQAEGLSRAEMAQRFPEALYRFRADPALYPLPGGEDPVKAAERFVGCLYEIAQRHRGERVLIIAHTTAIRLALCQLIGVPLGEYRRLFPQLHNCSRTELSFAVDHVSLLEFNTPVPMDDVPTGTGSDS